MHIILVSDHMATARSITLTGRHMLMATLGLIATVLVLSSMMSYVAVRHAAEIRLPFLQDMLRSVSLEEAGKTQDLVRENLANMAARLGQMQGQLMQLDTLGERVAGMAGVKIKDIRPAPVRPEKEGRGGPFVRPDYLTPVLLQQALDEMARQVDSRSDVLTLLEHQLIEERIQKSLLPTTYPIAGSVGMSSFGWRVDPFTGRSALHEGIDFMADPGTPILAAAAGIVTTAERHPQYGNMVEIDHGDDLITRYAHASATFVKEGEIIKRGQKIAAVGSTGRSSGPHLHFEVRIKGVPQNPARFLDQGAVRLAKR